MIQLCCQQYSGHFVSTLRRMIPKRKHGCKYKKSSNLPPYTPIIGMGCSSFSTFFNKEPSKEENRSLHNVCQSNAHEVVQKSNPLVKSWIDTIHYAIKHGIVLLDTAPWYGHGTSEVVIGYAMEAYSFDHNEESSAGIEIHREDLIINTKVGRYDANPKYQFDYTYNTTLNSVKRSIQRMKCQYIDVIQIHDPEFAHPNINILMEETLPALMHCRDELRIVKAIGLTGYPLEVQHFILEEVMRNEKLGGSGEVIFDQCLTYCHFNLHSQALFIKPLQDMASIVDKTNKNSQRTSSEKSSTNQSFAQYCKKHELPLMAAAPLSMGLLTPNPPPQWHPCPQSLQDACQKAAAVARDYGNVDLPSLAIIFALVNGDISCTLLGMANKKEVNVLLDVVKRVDEISYVLDDDSNALGIGDAKNNLKKKTLSTLQAILTEDEMRVLRILVDASNGPFAEVWSSGDYEWDGISEAQKFWTTLSN